MHIETSKHQVDRKVRRTGKKCRWLDLCKFSLRSLTHLHLLHCNSSMKPRDKSKRQTEKERQNCVSNKQAERKAAERGLLGVREQEEKRGTPTATQLNVCGQMLKI